MDLNDDLYVESTQNNLEPKGPLTLQQGLQVLMGTQGVVNCEFTAQ